MAKYLLRKDLKLKVGDITLYRIERVATKELGGYIESEANLSQDGSAWVSGNARVFGSAWVSGNARVFGNARVSGHAQVFGNARVFGHAEVFGNARVFGHAEVSGHAQVFGNAYIDSVSAILVLIITMKYSVTITRQYVAIGCQTFKRKDIKTITLEQAEKLGLPRALFKGYKQMILGAMKLVKPIKKAK